MSANSLNLFVAFIFILFCQQLQSETVLTKEQLGEKLFFDSSLSFNKTQSCATCHAPEHAFVDPRDNVINRSVSLGDDGHSFGDRNTPTAAYAALTPEFHQNKEGEYVGGFFLDGRRDSLKAQAGDPILNPIEMAMPDKASVVARIRENPVYIKAFSSIYGDTMWADTGTAYSAISDSIAAFERTSTFMPFDSKYDRYLQGKYQLTDEEDLGMTLFFSQQFTNCNLCHQLRYMPGKAKETFSNYKFHNIGVPVNQAVRSKNGSVSGYRDRGLLDNPVINDFNQDGKFKTPTLRNVAVTAPYMHNGVFKDLKTVVLFYNKYNSKSEKRQVNPETGQQWSKPETAINISEKELKTGPALDDRKIDALVAFLKILTDKRYEHLLGD